MQACTTLEERLEILTATEKGEPAWRIERRTRWSRKTIDKWRLRGRREGRAGLVSQMGRPKRGALSSYPVEVRDLITRWRQEYPGWGAVTIAAELRRHPYFEGRKVPSVASINRFLQEQE